jgi:hypothetical protein
MMPLVDDADVQIHLPVDKLKVEAIPDDKAKAFEDAERIIRGYLAGVFETATLAAWSTPANTPPEIRAVGGRLAAALIYRTRFSENALTDPQFAQVKYNEGMKMLEDIIAGRIVLTGVIDVAIEFDNTYFEPTDASTDPPKFTMSGRF